MSPAPRGPFSVVARCRSLTHALRGIRDLVQSQHNAWIHASATVVVFGLAAALRLPALDWALLVLAALGVWTAEAVNTAVEHLVDLVSPDVHPLAGRAKDVAAGAVLIAASGAAVIGLLVFGPRAWGWLH